MEVEVVVAVGFEMSERLLGSRDIWETKEYPTTYYYSFVPFSVLKNDPHS